MTNNNKIDYIINYLKKYDRNAYNTLQWIIDTTDDNSNFDELLPQFLIILNKYGLSSKYISINNIGFQIYLNSDIFFRLNYSHTNGYHRKHIYIYFNFNLHSPINNIYKNQIYHIIHDILMLTCLDYRNNFRPYQLGPLILARNLWGMDGKKTIPELANKGAPFGKAFTPGINRNENILPPGAFAGAGANNQRKRTVKKIIRKYFNVNNINYFKNMENGGGVEESKD